MKEHEVVKRDEFEGFAVSTIYAADVEMYETMILYPDEKTGTRYVLAQRYETKEKAEKGHEEVLKNVLDGKVYDGKDEIFDELQKKGDIGGMLGMLNKAIKGRRKS